MPESKRGESEFEFESNQEEISEIPLPSDGADPEKNFPLEENGREEVVVEVEKVVSEKKFGEKDVEKFPEGGFGWIVIVGTFFIFNATYGMINSFGVYQVYYEQRYPSTKSSVIALIGALQPTMMYLASVPVIWMHNTIGVRFTILLGSAIMVFALMMTSICNAVWQVYLAQGVLYGFGAGIAFFTANAVPPQWFKEKRALAVGLSASGSSLGGVIWPIAFQRLVDEVGFGWANRIIAFIYIPILTFSIICVKSRIPKTKKQIMPNWGVCKDMRFLWISLAYSIGFLGLFPPIFFIAEFTQRVGARPNISQYILTILNATSTVGRILPPFFGDKIGRLNVVIPSVLLTGVLQFALWLPARGEALVIAFAVFWGMASGSFVAVFPAALGQLFGIKDFNSRLTVMFLMAAPATLLGPSVTGLWIPNDAIGIEGFNKVIIFSGTMMLASSVMSFMLRLSYSRKLLVFI